MKRLFKETYRFHRCLMIAAIAAMLTGCGALQSATQWAQDNELAAELITSQATLRVIDDDVVRANRVLEIASDLRERVDGARPPSIAQLVGYVESEIRWDRLSAADEDLLRMLLARAESDLTERFGDGVLSADERIGVLQFVGWIEAAAQRSLARG